MGLTGELNSIGHYILSTGQADFERLRHLHAVYGPGTESGLRRAGVCRGARVVELGCGSGNISCWAAEQVGVDGLVVGMDSSPDQIEQAWIQARRRGLTNVQFLVADAYAPPLLEIDFDVAYCRLMLSHLTDPAAALAGMRTLVKPGGTVFCEELDLTCWSCHPPSTALCEFFRLNLALGELRGEDFMLGGKLPELFRRAGLARSEVSANFAVRLTGPEKRLLKMTFDEFAEEVVQERLASQAEVDAVAEGMERIAADETTLIGFPALIQAYAKR